MDSDELLLLPGHDAGDVFLQLFLSFRSNHASPRGDGEDDVHVNLGVGVGHRRRCAAPTELGVFFRLVL